jgi:large subunit ribosomal protein L24
MRPVRTGTVKSKIKRGDQVVFIAGKEYNRYDSAGKRQPFRGKVIEVDSRNGKVKIDGAMICKRHRKAVPQMNVEGGIIQQEAWVDVSNVALIDPDSGKPTRARYEDRDGEKMRVGKSGKEIPVPQAFRTPKKEKKDEE